MKQKPIFAILSPYFDYCEVKSMVSKKRSQKSRFSRLCKRNEFVLISFFTSIVISLVFWLVYNLSPFGSMSVMRMDMFHQYGPLLSEYFDRLTGHGSIVYSWHSGGGGNFLGNVFNYCSSPLELLVLLFGHKHVPQFIAFIIMLKGAFASANFTYYLKKSTQFQTQNLLTAGFGLLYAFSGYFVAYYWNFMWLDGMMLLPLIILGLEQIVDQGKPWLYTATFTILLVASYYMAYMTAIFMVLYFLVYYIGKYPGGVMVREPKRNEKGKVPFFESVRCSHFVHALLRCIGYAIVAGALAAFALLPTYYALKSCSATSGTFPKDTSLYFNFFDFLANHTDALDPTIRSSEDPVLPNIFCGIGTVVLAILFFFIKSIPLREKISDAVMLVVLFFSFDINKLNYIWHGFHFPNDLPYRQSFVYVFFLLLMAFKALSRIRELQTRDVLTVGLITAAFIAVIGKVGSKNTSQGSLITTLAFWALYIICFALLTNKKFRTKTIASVLFCCMFAEVIIADVGNFEVSLATEDFNGDYKEVKNIERFIDDYDGTDLYRMELCENYRIMNPSWYGYNGICEFSSMAYESSANLQYNLGLAGNYINSYIYAPQTPVYNAMFSMKYLVDNDPDNVKLNGNYFEKIGHTDNMGIYRNRYWLPLAYSVNNSVKHWDYYNNDPVKNQEDFWERATGVKGALEEDTIDEVTFNNISPFPQAIESNSYTFEKEDDSADGSFTMSFTPDKTRNYFLCVRSPQIDKLTVEAEDGSLKKEQDCSTDQEYLMDLGTLKAGVRIDITCPVTQDSGTVDVSLASVNGAAFQQGYNQLNDSGAMKFTKLKETDLEGDVTIGNNQFLYTSINYDPGWTIYVDGNKVSDDDIVKVGNALIGVNMTPGRHHVRFVYHAKGMKEGLIITFIALILVLLFTVFLPNSRKRKGGSGDDPDKKNRPLQLYYKKPEESKYNDEDRLYDDMFQTDEDSEEN